MEVKEHTRYTPFLLDSINIATISAMENEGVRLIGRAMYDAQIKMVRFLEPGKTPRDTERTLYHLYVRPDGYHDAGYPRQRIYAVLYPVSNGEPNCLTLKDTLNILTREPHNPNKTYFGQLNMITHDKAGREVSNYPDEILIPIGAVGRSTYNKNSKHWMLLRVIPGDYKIENNKAQIYLYDPRKDKHSEHVPILQTAMAHFLCQPSTLHRHISNSLSTFFWGPSDDDVAPPPPHKKPILMRLPQQSVTNDTDCGPWLNQNLCTLIRGIELKEDQTYILERNIQYYHFFTAQGDHEVARTYLLPSPNFWKRNKTKISLLACIIASATILASFILMAPHLTASAIFAAALKMGLDVSYIGLLSLQQFTLIASGVFAALISTGISVGIFSLAMFTLIKSQFKPKVISFDDWDDLLANSDDERDDRLDPEIHEVELIAPGKPAQQGPPQKDIVELLALSRSRVTYNLLTQEERQQVNDYENSKKLRFGK